jgi:hypothetical protein
MKQAPSSATIKITSKYGPVTTGEPTFAVTDSATLREIAERLEREPQKARPRKALWTAIGFITLRYPNGEEEMYLIGPASFAKVDADVEYSFGNEFHPWLIGLLEKLQPEEP